MSVKIIYNRQGNYNLPNLTLPEQNNREIGVWGQRRRLYLKEHQKFLYYNPLTKCKLHEHLADINEEATEMYDKLVKQLAKQEGITEQLKAEDKMLWVQRMNNICNRATEIFNRELIIFQESSIKRQIKNSPQP